MSDDFAQVPFAVERLHCPYCNAAPGSKCVTDTGRPNLTHDARWLPVATAYSIGHQDGYAEGFSEGRRWPS